MPRRTGRLPCPEDYLSPWFPGGDSGVDQHLSCSAALLLLENLIPIETKHKDANGRRQVTLLPLGIDRLDKIRRTHVAPGGDLFQPLPECIFEADARLVASDDDRTLDDCRFQSSPRQRRSGVKKVAAWGIGGRPLRNLVLPAVGGVAAMQIIELLSQSVSGSLD